MSRAKPERGVSYAADGPGGFLAHSREEACRSLGRYLGVETRDAARMLADGSAAAEVRSRNNVPADPGAFGIAADGSLPPMSGREADGSL